MEDIEACELEADEKMISSQSNLIVYNNQLIPFLNLRTSFSDGGVATGREKIIVINRQNRYYAIVADTIIGEYQAVVKPLGKTFCDIKFLSGASILGDGSIALLLDTDKLRFEITSGVEQTNLN